MKPIVIPKHVHKFVIPVEWEYWWSGGRVKWEQTPTGKRVTKLRCECGEETSR